jgi:hypothetical protein
VPRKVVKGFEYDCASLGGNPKIPTATCAKEKLIYTKKDIEKVKIALFKVASYL